MIPGLTELMLFYIERGADFAREFGDIDEAFHAGAISVFPDGMKMLDRCEEGAVRKLLPRSEDVIGSTARLPDKDVP